MQKDLVFRQKELDKFQAGFNQEKLALEINSRAFKNVFNQIREKIDPDQIYDEELLNEYN